MNARGLMALALWLVAATPGVAQPAPARQGPAKPDEAATEKPAADKPADKPAATEPAPATAGAVQPEAAPPSEAAGEPDAAQAVSAPAPAAEGATQAEAAAPQPQPVAPPEPPPASPPIYPKLGGPVEPEIEEGEWDPWEHAMPYAQRHDGFYLRLSIGIGGGSASGDDHIAEDVDEVSINGAGFASSIGIGGAIFDNFILFGDFFQLSMLSTSVERDGTEVGDFEARHELGVSDLRMPGLGLGLAYYFMPVNIYVSGSFGLGQAVFDHDGDASGSDLGFAGNLMIGKEWWVNDDWGIGLAGQLLVLVTEDDIIGDITGLGYSVMFSATYN